MKTFLSAAVAACSVCALADALEWENLAVNSENRLPPRTYSMPLAAALPCWDRRCPLLGSAFSPVRGFDLPCTGVSLPLYGQDNFPFMGVK